ncbi:hypothetical protein E2C01_027303 [Portunus trituberculatus]|uniref:Uncharacterized protein n=1 Tax=Portunus trituberculatus TaxID=210409 RepID=A0A5B7ELK1_PORTR|nr:hypothetical protein [Portunus trituberculatus]
MSNDVVCSTCDIVSLYNVIVRHRTPDEMALLVVTLTDSRMQRSIVVMLLLCHVTTRTSYDIAALT